MTCQNFFSRAPVALLASFFFSPRQKISCYTESDSGKMRGIMYSTGLQRRARQLHLLGWNTSFFRHHIALTSSRNWVTSHPFPSLLCISCVCVPGLPLGAGMAVARLACTSCSSSLRRRCGCRPGGAPRGGGRGGGGAGGTVEDARFDEVKEEVYVL